MGCIILEYVLSVSIDRKDFIQVLYDSRIVFAEIIAVGIILPENRVQGSWLAVDHRFTCAVIDFSSQGTVNTAQVDHQFSVYIQPDIVIARKLIDNIMSPCVLAVRCLHKRGFQFKAEVMIRIIDLVEPLIFTGVIVRQRLLLRVIEILPVVSCVDTGSQIVVGHELAVFQRWFLLLVYCSQLLVDLKCEVILKRGEVLRAVEFIIPRPFVDIRDEKVIDLFRFRIQVCQRSPCSGTDRISLIIQPCGNQILHLIFDIFRYSHHIMLFL